MRYVLTFRWGELWSETDTIIVDEERTSDECGERWFDKDENVARVLVDYGLDGDQVAEIISSGWWYVRNCDDVDYYVNEKGEII